MHDVMQLQPKKISSDKDSELAKSNGINIKIEPDTFYEGADESQVHYQRNDPLNRRFHPNNNRVRFNRGR